MEKKSKFDDRITPHSLRHTAVTLALQAGANILQVQAMARHKDIATTMVYVHNLTRIEDAAEKKINKILCSISKK